MKRAAFFLLGIFLVITTTWSYGFQVEILSSEYSVQGNWSYGVDSQTYSGAFDFSSTNPYWDVSLPNYGLLDNSPYRIFDSYSDTSFGNFNFSHYSSGGSPIINWTDENNDDHSLTTPCELATFTTAKWVFRPTGTQLIINMTYYWNGDYAPDVGLVAYLTDIPTSESINILNLARYTNELKNEILSYDVNPTHEYQLAVYGGSIAVDKDRADQFFGSEITSVSEPATISLLIIGLFGLIGLGRQKK